MYHIAEYNTENRCDINNSNSCSNDKDAEAESVGCRADLLPRLLVAIVNVLAKRPLTDHVSAAICCPQFVTFMHIC